MLTPVRWPLLTALCAASLCPAGCLPSHAAFVRLGVTFPDGRPSDLAILDVPIQELHARKPDLDPQQMAVYYLGRDPIPHELLDQDQDGRPDHVRVKMRAEMDEAWLVFVSPGVASAEPLPEGGEQVAVRYHHRR